MDRTWSLLEDLRRAGKRILFEGAQGALLDIDHGTYPFVTSSNTVAGNARDRLRPRPQGRAVRAGHRQGLHDARRRRARSRASSTDETGQLLGERGHEFGTVTGRPRRCGWFDAVLVRQTVKTSGIDGIALHQARRARRLRRDQGLHRLQARRRGDRLPAREPGRAGARRADLRNRSKAGRAPRRAPARGPTCPPQAVKYVRRVEELIEAPVALLSTSPERADTILVHNPFRD